MYPYLLTLLIVAAGDGAPTEHCPEAKAVFRCTFDRAWDGNYDGWPDDWTRRRGPGYPHYLKMEIDEQVPWAGGNSFRIDVNGGAGMAISPPVDISPLYEWVLEADLRTAGLQLDSAYVSLTLLDEQMQRLATFESPRLRGTTPWTRVRVGPVEATQPNARHAVIGLHVEPARGKLEDLRGSVWYGDLWLGRIPRMVLELGKPLNLFDKGEPVRVACRLPGAADGKGTVTFRLEDHRGTRLAEHQEDLVAEPYPLERAAGDNARPDTATVMRAAEWAPPIDAGGFYRIGARTVGESGHVDERRVGLAVLESLGRARSNERVTFGEFGWTLPRGEQPFPQKQLNELIDQAGVQRIKYPIWQGSLGDDAAVERFLAWCDRLQRHGVTVTGMLWPPRADDQESPQAGNQAADLFTADVESWFAPMETHMSRLVTRIRTWQLGADEDQSFVGYPLLEPKLKPIEARLNRFGEGLGVGFGWNWLHTLPQAAGEKAPWQFVSLSMQPPATADNLAAYLEVKPPAGLERWVVLQPLPRGRYATDARADDLARRMIAAKLGRAEGVFLADPFAAESGLATPAEGLSEMFLPWRTVSTLLGGGTPLGSIEMPGRSANHVFARDGDAVMIAWNTQPVQETLYLGERVRQFDLWGRSQSPADKNHQQTAAIGRELTFLTGLNTPVARWRMAFALAPPRIASLFGESLENEFRWKNTFPQRVSGRAEVVGPEPWSFTPRVASFRLEPGEEFRMPLAIRLPSDVTIGEHQVRVDFQVQAVDTFRFSVYRTITVGLGDVVIEAMATINELGNLQVEQRLTNHTGRKLAFRCQVYAPQRQRQLADLLDIGPGTHIHRYQIPNGQELLGRTIWLRAEELNGARILNYRFVAGH